MEIPQKNSGEQIAEDPEEIETGEQEENREKEKRAKIELIKEILEMHFPKIIRVAKIALDKKEFLFQMKTKKNLEIC